MIDPMKEAIQAAAASASIDGGPFGAVVVLPSGEAFTANNQVTALSDPTAHAEIQAIRAAAAHLGSHGLSGATLYTSCQPCPMCLTAALWARLDRIVYAADQEDAAAAGFDDSAFYAQLREGLSTVTMAAIERREDEGRLIPFQVWKANEQRVDY